MIKKQNKFERITIVEGNKSQFVENVNKMLKSGKYYAHWETFSAWAVGTLDPQTYCRIVMEEFEI
jgi:hypothetical protein